MPSIRDHIQNLRTVYKDQSHDYLAKKRKYHLRFSSAGKRRADGKNKTVGHLLLCQNSPKTMMSLICCSSLT